MTLEEFYIALREALESKNFITQLFNDKILRFSAKAAGGTRECFCPITCVIKHKTGEYFSATFADSHGRSILRLSTHDAVDIMYAADALERGTKQKEIREKLFEIAGVK